MFEGWALWLRPRRAAIGIMTGITLGMMTKQVMQWMINLTAVQFLLDLFCNPCQAVYCFFLANYS